MIQLKTFRNPLVIIAVAAIAMGAMTTSASAARVKDRTVTIFDSASITYDAALVDPLERDDHVVLRNGQVLQRTIALPVLPKDMADATRITAVIVVEPVMIKDGKKQRPGDPWTRMGSVSIVKPGAELMPRSIPPDEIKDDVKLPSPEDDEIELVRFITGFGGATTFTQDVTALAPLLAGRQTIRLYLSTWLNPAWKVTLTLNYDGDEQGPRRPTFAENLFNDQSVNSDENTLSATVTIPDGLARPRIRILSTGHATDGTDGDEFTARNNTLKVDGKTIAMFRPWSEAGATLRKLNPTSGRITVDDRQLWSSDLDRAGWHPGLVVEPIFIPARELTPGKHTVTISIADIRPKDESGLGYWRVSAIVVADEPWPEQEETKKSK